MALRFGTYPLLEKTYSPGQCRAIIVRINDRFGEGRGEVGVAEVFFGENKTSSVTFGDNDDAGSWQNDCKNW